MNENTKTPIGCMADLLAEMAERAMEAERQRDVEKERGDQWYRHHQNKADLLKVTEEKLAEQIKENERLRGSFAEYIDSMQKGAQDNE